MQTMNKEIQAAMTPQDALAQLREGNQRFVNHAMLERNLLHQVEETKTGQAPFAALPSSLSSVAVGSLMDGTRSLQVGKERTVPASIELEHVR